MITRELTEEMGALSFNDIEMRNTIMLVCHSLVESMYIELTLSKLEDKQNKTISRRNQTVALV